MPLSTAADVLLSRICVTCPLYSLSSTFWGQPVTVGGQKIVGKFATRTTVVDDHSIVRGGGGGGESRHRVFSVIIEISN